MKKFNILVSLVLSLTMMVFISGCGGDNTTTASTGVLSLSIADAPPKLGDNVTEVNIAVVGIEYNYNGNWVEAEEFKPQSFNLLDLQNGNSLHLGDLILPAGHYTEIRFKLAAPVKVDDVKSNPDCNIVFADGTSEPLFVPSGGQSGYKGKGEFDVIGNAKVSITADFDVHKSIVVTGNRKYILKPVIRLVVTELSGVINGTVVDIGNYDVNTGALVVYTYQSGEYNTSEETEVDGVVFANSISSADVNMSDGNFTLPFLGEGNYSLITAQYIGDTFALVVDQENNVEVLNAQSTLVDINTTD